VHSFSFYLFVSLSFSLSLSLFLSLSSVLHNAAMPPGAIFEVLFARDCTRDTPLFTMQIKVQSALTLPPRSSFIFFIIGAAPCRSTNLGCCARFRGKTQSLADALPEVPKKRAHSRRYIRDIKSEIKSEASPSFKMERIE